MFNKKSIEKLKLKTQMSDIKNVVIKSFLKSEKENAVKHLSLLQEQYKELFGEYSREHILESNDENQYSEAKWSVNSAKRKDGTVFNVGDSFEIENAPVRSAGKVFTIKSMHIVESAGFGCLMAVPEEGEPVNLYEIKVKFL